MSRLQATTRRASEAASRARQTVGAGAGRLARGVGGAWAAVRPRSRRGTLAFVGLIAACSVVLFVGAAAASSVVTQYAFRPAANETAWRGLTPAFGDVTECAGCHTLEYGRLTSATHAGIGCESCHGPLGQHALASPGTPEAKVSVVVPTDEVCVKCHVAATGRPAGFRQIVPTDHYVSECLQCHDPHTGVSRRPPVVQHTLERLPPCVTCHGPEGFKARNQRHPTTATDDTVCLSCHLPGRGPADDPSRPS
jgi:hypothetical protein